MRISERRARPAAIVIGADEIGSAVAVALHRAGYATVICDDVDPPWARRGMAFTNAWYLGNAELDGEAAVFCASAKSTPSVLRREDLIAATTWSWRGVAALLDPVLIVEARPSRRRDGRTLKAFAPVGALTIGVGDGYVGGVDVDIAIGCAVDGPLAAFVGAGSTDSDAGPAGAVECGGREPVVRAQKVGRFATSRRIGDRVRQGETVGAIGSLPVVAPIAGVLRGLSARGAALYEGALLVEVDPRGDPDLCFGIDEDAQRIARRVVSALRHRPGDANAAPEPGAVETLA